MHFLTPLGWNPWKTDLGQLGFYTILFEFFQKGYFGLCGPWGLVQNLHGVPCKSNLDQKEKLGNLRPPNHQSLQRLSGPFGFLLHLVQIYFGSYVWPIWAKSILMSFCLVSLKKTNCTKQEFWRIHTLSTTSPSKVYLGQFGSYPILFDFLSKWCYQNFWYYSKNVSKSFSRDINIKSLSPQEIQDISNKLIS